MNMNLPKTTGNPNPDALLAARRREVENALLTQALCGRKPSAATLAQLRRYETGELSREQAFASLYRGAQ
ncbi:MAG: hypothetical protein EOO62_16415 [Hymenobacter sp.]|nr:MAG: hypothetical protein EOO62_16415 [Hymenobacter sp.]